MLSWDAAAGVQAPQLETLSSQQVLLAETLREMQDHPQSGVIADGLLHILERLAAPTISVTEDESIPPIDSSSTTGTWRCVATLKEKTTHYEYDLHLFEAETELS